MKNNNQNEDNEKLISALVSSGTIKEAAKAAGCSESVIYNRLRDEKFFELLQIHRSEYLREALNAIQKNTLAAVNTIAEIMQDKSVNPQWRLLAADSILKKHAELTSQLASKENSFIDRGELNF